MFENKQFEGIYYSRFIASWVKVNGKIYKDEFEDWLRSLTINGKKIPEDVIYDIYNMGTCGKMELETSIKRTKESKLNRAKINRVKINRVNL